MSQTNQIDAVLPIDIDVCSGPHLLHLLLAHWQPRYHHLDIAVGHIQFLSEKFKQKISLNFTFSDIGWVYPLIQLAFMDGICCGLFSLTLVYRILRLWSWYLRTLFAVAFIFKRSVIISNTCSTHWNTSLKNIQPTEMYRCVRKEVKKWKRFYLKPYAFISKLSSAWIPHSNIWRNLL